MKIGILGAGQLGRMLALAGYPLGQSFSFLDSSSEAPAASLGDMHTGKLDDADKLSALARQCDVVTFEFENIPAPLLHQTMGDKPFHPPIEALAQTQDRLVEKRLFGSLSIPTPRHEAVDSLEDLQRATEKLGLPAVVKTRRLGYDGRGQAVVREAGDIEEAWETLGSVPLILEEFIPFDTEASLVAVRGAGGETAFYPMAENEHRNGILHVSRAPYGTSELQRQAERYLTRLMDRLNYVGTMTVEFFVKDRNLIANEVAPRVHNSGHWTIEGAECSQFENHVRAVAGLPLGSTRARGHSGMINLLGTMPDTRAVLSTPGAHLHDYGKSPRPGRKLGHCTVVADTPEERDAQVAHLLEIRDAG